MRVYLYYLLTVFVHSHLTHYRFTPIIYQRYVLALPRHRKRVVVYLRSRTHQLPKFYLPLLLQVLCFVYADCSVVKKGYEVIVENLSINLLAIRLYTLNDLQSSELFIEPERDNLVRTRDKVENSRVVDGEEPCDGGIFMVGTSILL